VFIATSLDGYIARPDGGIDWLERVELAGEDYGFADFFASVDALVMGRATYDVVSSFAEWPYADKRLYVLTNRPAEAVHGEVFVAGTPGEVLERVAADGAQHVYVDGGVVIRQFAAAGLIDRYTISIIPIMLGAGIRLFAGGEGEHGLVLERSHSWAASGLVQVVYSAR
jgi:dihydrofolate reductase